MLRTTSYGAEGPRIAFCHGLFGQGKNWTQIGKSLAACGYRVTLVDLPNHGASPWTEEFSYAGMAEALLERLRDIDPAAPWALLGHSMGGKTVMLAALRDSQFVRRLIVVDMSPVSYGGLSSFQQYVDGMRSLNLQTLRSRSEADQALLSYVEDDSVRAFLLQNLRRDGDGFTWQMNLDLLGDSLPLLGGWPEEDISQGARYEGPVLWIAGSDSPYVKPEYGPAMRELFPHTRLVTIKGTGHWPHSQKPDVFVQTLRSFLTATQ